MIHSKYWGVKKSFRIIRVLTNTGHIQDELEDGDEDIAEYGDETVILCIDQYSIYDGIDEYDESNGHVVNNHDQHYVVDDAHTNSCENRHSYLTAVAPQIC